MFLISTRWNKFNIKRKAGHKEYKQWHLKWDPIQLKSNFLSLYFWCGALQDRFMKLLHTIFDLGNTLVSKNLRRLGWCKPCLGTRLLLRQILRVLNKTRSNPFPLSKCFKVFNTSKGSRKHVLKVQISTKVQSLPQVRRESGVCTEMI